MLLFFGLGELYLPLKKLKYKELYIYDKNECINLLSNMNNKISYNLNIDIKTSDIIHDNIIKKNVDLIICNIPLDYKNIIYAECNSLIKNLKIRGTKVEPLILQFLMQLINKNGTIMLYTSSSLLFSESNQHIETRKYLLENFNLQKIINLENKKSLLIIKNNKDFKNIEVIKKNKSFIVEKEKINKTNYSLDFIKPDNEFVGNNKIKLFELIDIKNKNEIDEINYNVLYNYKFNDFNIGTINKSLDFNYVFLSKDENIIKQEFLNLCLNNFFIKNIEKITKGKMNKFSPDLLEDLELMVMPITTQQLMLKQIELNNTIINNNNTQIKNFIELLNKFIESIISNNDKTLKLFNIFNITNDITNKSVISIKKNSLTVGTIEIINNKEDYKNNTNYFYFEPINKEENINFYYYLLKYYQTNLLENAFKNKSIGLNKTFLENFELPILKNEEKDHLVLMCEYFYQQIEILEKNTILLKEINVINLII
jgi:hypothetical protein